MKFLLGALSLSSDCSQFVSLVCACVLRYEIGQYWRLLKTHLKVVPHKVLVAALDKVRAALEDGTLNEQEHRIGSDGAGVDDDEGQESHSRKKGKKNAVNKMEIAVSIMIGNVAVVLQMLGDYAVAAKLQEEVGSWP